MGISRGGDIIMNKTNLQKAEDLLFELRNNLALPNDCYYSKPEKGHVAVNVKLHNMFVDIEDILDELNATEEEREMFNDEWLIHQENSYIETELEDLLHIFKSGGKESWNPIDFVKEHPEWFWSLYEVRMWDAFRIVTGELYLEGRSGGYLVFGVTISDNYIEDVAYELDAEIADCKEDEITFPNRLLEDYKKVVEDMKEDLDRIDRVIEFIEEGKK